MDAEHPAVLNDDASMNPSPNSTATSVFPPEEANSSHLKSLPLGELKMKMKEHGVYESPTTPMDGQAQLSTGCKQTHHQETNADATPANVSEQRLDATTDGPLSHDVSNGHVDAKEFDQTSVLRTSQNEKTMLQKIYQHIRMSHLKIQIFAIFLVPTMKMMLWIKTLKNS